MGDIIKPRRNSDPKVQATGEPVADGRQAYNDGLLREGLKTKSESIWGIYLRRFKKHNLGKIGFGILLVLYVVALFADILSPYSMSWSDKLKPYHPPATIYWFYSGADGSTSLRPYVFEQRIVNQAFREYGVLPERTIRVISIEPRVGTAELRAIASERTEPERRASILRQTATHFRVLEPETDPMIANLARELDRIERDPDPDARYRVQIGTMNIMGQQVPREVWIAKGNKNFLSFFGEGVHYSFLGLFSTDIHFFSSPTGGFFPLGTDASGRDLLSRLIHGSRISLTVGLVGAAITFAIGLLIGGIAGYAGGWVDNILMRMAEVIISVPSIYLLFALRASFPPTLDSVQVYLLIVVVLSLIGWAGLSRIIRGLVLAIKTEDYVLAARTMGLSHLKIIIKHVLPNTLSFVIIQITLTIPGYILGESALSLLGLGISEPQSSWGLMLAVGRNYRVVRDFPWILVPGFMIFLAILAWNFFGDGVRDSVDPKSKH